MSGTKEPILELVWESRIVNFQQPYLVELQYSRLTEHYYDVLDPQYHKHFTSTRICPQYYGLFAGLIDYRDHSLVLNFGIQSL